MHTSSHIRVGLNRLWESRSLAWTWKGNNRERAKRAVRVQRVIVGLEFLTLQRPFHSPLEHYPYTAFVPASTLFGYIYPSCSFHSPPYKVCPKPLHWRTPDPAPSASDFLWRIILTKKKNCCPSYPKPPASPKFSSETTQRIKSGQVIIPIISVRVRAPPLDIIPFLTCGEVSVTQGKLK